MRRFDSNKKYIFSAESFKAKEGNVNYIRMKDIIDFCDGKEVEQLNCISGIIKGDTRDFRIAPRWCIAVD